MIEDLDKESQLTPSLYTKQLKTLLLELKRKKLWMC